MKRLLSFFALSGVLAVAAPARADIIYTFASSSFNGTLGTSQAYTSGGYTIETYGFNSTLGGTSPTQTLTLGTATDLFAKYSGVGSGETGLGINSDPTGDHEITTTTAIEVNMASVLAANPNSPVTLTIGSVQRNEGYAVFGGSASPTTELGSFTNTNGSGSQFTFTITAAEAATSGGVFYVTATSGNVLLDTIDVAAVPEPATLTLALTGLGFAGGFGWIRRRRSARV